MSSTSTYEIPVGDLTFDVLISGPDDGIPLVALHGFPESAASWGKVTPLLTAAGYRVIAPNQRGYSAGARPEGVDAYKIEHLVADVVGLLDALGLSDAHLVGHDWGSAVAWQVAGRHPNRIRSLTAISVPHPTAFGWALREDEDQKQRSSYIGLLRQEGKAEEVLSEDNFRRLRAMFDGQIDPEFADEHIRVMSGEGALTGALNWYRAMTRDFGDIDRTTVPTTYVWSTGDTALGRAGAERCGEFVDAPYEFVVLDGGSHWIPEERAEELAEAILARAGS
ncbi:alpha/beta hydrolase [Rhodococcus erythropolis]|jgi:pimeloyl-ACP methyl ester carboxylesterase|uniref:Alpha/beta hydrolase n=1 Tax=Rhodococcus erythropolis TaxID=1833 RepID=A0AAX3V1M7_RHOER|nr:MULTISPECIES: alpha/beta hydrolase [Rhodococcus]AGT93405.1 epoxide hydrolase [Rhodococcus erythropolis CCM2595]MBF7734403.1 alpha/beta hydrolase [Rhodococcus erythropolis]MCJ0898289.1 alpha/beta hydrolase [Rhodococcus sp. ARC_M13]MCS4254509.1 pimeloyl-ACP methyl ester carboxylesterase [Rhodococcus erythropolis]MCW2431396.1 pimeloyl-ACP methyl ester carboxylesterase [Rhodococcus erythropolis]